MKSCCGEEEDKPCGCNVPVVGPVRRNGFCPDWARCITPSSFGDLLVRVGTCLHNLVSDCSGLVKWSPKTGAEITPVFDLDQPYGARQTLDSGKFVLAEEVVVCRGYDKEIKSWRHKVQSQPVSKSSGSLAVVTTDCDDNSRIDYLVPRQENNALPGYVQLYGRVLTPTADCAKSTIEWMLAGEREKPNEFQIPEFDGITDTDCYKEVEPVFVKKICDDGTETIQVYWREIEV